MGLLAGYTRESKNTAYRLGVVENHFSGMLISTVNTSERMDVFLETKVGMGTDSPSAILHVKQS